MIENQAANDAIKEPIAKRQGVRDIGDREGYLAGAGFIACLTQHPGRKIECDYLRPGSREG